MAETVRHQTLGQIADSLKRSEAGDCVHFAQSRFLDEIPGVAFAVITLIWIVASFASLIWK